MNQEQEYDAVRKPDSVIRERLIEPETETDYDMAIRQSLIDHENETQRQEQQIIDAYYCEKWKRSVQFRDLLTALQRLSKHDAVANEIYEMVNHIVTQYCDQTADIIKVDEATYKKMFGFLRTMRTDIDAFKCIVLCE